MPEIIGSRYAFSGCVLRVTFMAGETGGKGGKVYPGPQKWKNDGGDGWEPTIHKTGPFHGLCLSFAIPQRQAQGAMGPFQNWKGPSERSKGPLSA